MDSLSTSVIALTCVFSAADLDWMSAMSRATSAIPKVRCVRPEPRFISTSHCERLNLRFRCTYVAAPRRTNALSKKLANHKACFALWVAWYNVVRVKSAIRMTPAMASGLATSIWSCEICCVQYELANQNPACDSRGCLGDLALLDTS
jgi:hypothetical protein